MSERLPLILLPGLLCDESLWWHQIETLDDIADVSVANLTLDDSVEAMASRVLGDSPERFSLAGLSMGGYVAQEIMRQAPERVARLALVDTAARADTPEQTKTRKALIEHVSVGQFKGVTTRLLPLLIHADRLADARLTGAVREMTEHVGKESYLRQQTAIMGRPDGRRDLADIRCPTLVMCGRQDALTPVKVHEEMADGIANSHLVLIEDCGHLAPLERPRAVSAVMRYWLSMD